MWPSLPSFSARLMAKCEQVLTWEPISNQATFDAQILSDRTCGRQCARQTEKHKKESISLHLLKYTLSTFTT